MSETHVASNLKPMSIPTQHYADGVYLPHRSPDLNSMETGGAGIQFDKHDRRSAELSDADYITREVDKLAVGECEEFFEPSGPNDRKRGAANLDAPSDENAAKKPKRAALTGSASQTASPPTPPGLNKKRKQSSQASNRSKKARVLTQSDYKKNSKIKGFIVMNNIHYLLHMRPLLYEDLRYLSGRGKSSRTVEGFENFLKVGKTCGRQYNSVALPLEHPIRFYLRVILDALSMGAPIEDAMNYGNTILEKAIQKRNKKIIDSFVKKSYNRKKILLLDKWKTDLYEEFQKSVDFSLQVETSYFDNESSGDAWQELWKTYVNQATKQAEDEKASADEYELSQVNNRLRWIVDIIAEGDVDNTTTARKELYFHAKELCERELKNTSADEYIENIYKRTAFDILHLKLNMDNVLNYTRAAHPSQAEPPSTQPNTDVINKRAQSLARELTNAMKDTYHNKNSTFPYHVQMSGDKHETLIVPIIQESFKTVFGTEMEIIKEVRNPFAAGGVFHDLTGGVQNPAYDLTSEKRAPASPVDEETKVAEDERIVTEELESKKDESVAVSFGGAAAENITYEPKDAKTLFSAKLIPRKNFLKTELEEAIDGWENYKFYCMEQPAGKQGFPDLVLFWGAPAASLDVGTAIEARYLGDDEWYAGKIAAVNDSGTFDILYDDDDKEADVLKGFIRLAAGVTVVKFLYIEAKTGEQPGMVTTNDTILIPNIVYVVGRYIISGQDLTSWQKTQDCLEVICIRQVINTKLRINFELGIKKVQGKLRQAPSTHKISDKVFSVLEEDDTGKELLRQEHLANSLMPWLDGWVNE